MSTARAERLVNLVLCLLSTRQYLTAERIHDIVPGYRDSSSDEAFFRAFERDKSELRDLGIPLETGRNSAFDPVDGYRIARRDYELGEVDLEPDEAAAVALAARLWDSPQLTGAAHGALRKLRAAGVDVDDGAMGSVEPRVRTAEPAFAPLLAAVQRARPVRFDYRASNSAEVRRRTVEPWGVVSWRGRWYLIGHDRDRQAARCFRLSRVVSQVRVLDGAAAVTPPDEPDLLSYVVGSDDSSPSTTLAKLWVAHGRAQGLRRFVRVIEPLTVDGVAGDVVEIELRQAESAAGWIAGHGPDVLVMSPETLAKSVTERLLAVVGESGG